MVFIAPTRLYLYLVVLVPWKRTSSTSTLVQVRTWYLVPRNVDNDSLHSTGSKLRRHTQSRLPLVTDTYEFLNSMAGIPTIARTSNHYEREILNVEYVSLISITSCVKYHWMDGACEDYGLVR
jgi:hypothetical protein